MKWYDWLTIFSLFFIAIAFAVGGVVYYKEVVNECTSNPIVYGAGVYEDRYGYEVFGSLYLLGVPNDKITPLFNFNSSQITKVQ